MTENAPPMPPPVPTFLADLSTILRPLRNADEIKAAASNLLGQTLNVNRAFYAEVDGDHWLVEGGYVNGVPPLEIGPYSAETYGYHVMETYRAGKPLVFHDIRMQPGFSGEERHAHLAIGIIGAVGIPLVKDGRLTSILVVHSNSPRQWTEEEVQLVEVTAERTWEAVERARIEASHRESDERFRILTESLPQLVWSCHADGRCDYLSTQWVAYTGIPELEQLGFAWLERVIHPEDRERTREHWLGSVAGLHPYDIEYRIRRADGEYRWFQTRGVPLCDEGGKIVKWFGTCTEIEAQKQTQKALRASEAKYRSLFESIDEGFCIIEVLFDSSGRANDYRFLELNPAFERHTGLGNPIGRTVKELIPDHEDYWFERYGQIALTGVSARFSDRAEGLGRSYDVYGFRIGEPEDRHVAVIFTDVTEREKMAKALAASEERLRQVFAQAPVAVALFRGRDLVVELANPMYQEFLPGRDLIGKPLKIAMSEISDELLGILERVYDTGEPFVGHEYKVPLVRDGALEDHYFTFVYQPWRHVDQSILGVVVVAVDVTPQVRARQDLERVNKELEEFAYVASHDLREPMRMINIYSQLLVQRFGQDDQQAAAYSGFIREGTGRMERLLTDLLLYSKTAHEEKQTSHEAADLSVALSNAQADLNARITETKAVITADPLPKVAGDTHQLALVFQNLLSNALKYHDHSQPPEIRISARQEADKWIVSVKDNGIGFEQRFAQRIFGLFKRLYKDEYPGTGLGLAICQRIIERYGGRMWAESSPGHGATFYFSLPDRSQ